MGTIIALAVIVAAVIQDRRTVRGRDLPVSYRWMAAMPRQRARPVAARSVS
jgi:hypothetical protein